jgi:hypothetical protein
MNKRQRKKFEKKLCHKTYQGYKKAKNKKDAEDFIMMNASMFDKTMKALLASAFPNREEEIIHSDYLGQECTASDVVEIREMIQRINAVNKNKNIFGVPSQFLLGPLPMEKLNEHPNPTGYGLKSFYQIYDEFEMEQPKEAKEMIYVTTDPTGKEIVSAAKMGIFDPTAETLKDVKAEIDKEQLKSIFNITMEKKDE